jgi:ATP-dependent Clp protease ATP-binding subunit ClpB
MINYQDRKRVSGLRVYDIYIPELNRYVKFKVLPPEEIKKIMDDISDYDPSEHMRTVVENFVFNMRHEIVDALKLLSEDAGEMAVEALFNGCVMLNPGLDIDSWVRIAYSGVKPMPSDKLEKRMPKLDTSPISPEMLEKQAKALSNKSTAKKPPKITKAKVNNLSKHLKTRIVGQDEAVETLANALKRSMAGMNDEGRPLGVFLLAGSSGTGKTLLAKELHSYLFGREYDLVRIDCGEFQQKHENQKLIGSPPGYIGHEDGGMLTSKMREQPCTVLLLDEVEKAHPDIWNTFLRVFDEGLLTDNKGKEVSFRNSIIIMTTNLGNDKIVESLTGKGTGFAARIDISLESKETPKREIVEKMANEAIRKSFRPEFLNRIDKTVVFNHLSHQNYIDIAKMEIDVVDKKLIKKGFILNSDETVLNGLVDKGVNTIFGARGMSRVRREEIEDKIAGLIMGSTLKRGTIFKVSYFNNSFIINTLTN